MGRPWLAYTRVSRVGDRSETLISPELQLARIRPYAEARGLELEELPPELDVSGGKAERPILGKAVSRVVRGEAAGIIVAQLDRLSRMDITDALRVIEKIEGAGGQVIAIAENFDAATPEGRLARNMFLALGQMQLDRYRQGFAAAKRSAVTRGVWPTHAVPLGYRKGPERTLEVHQEEAELVRRAFRQRAAGDSWRSIATMLGRSQNGAKKLVNNRVYLGEVRLEVNGELCVNTEAHEPIVNRKTWERAQMARGIRPPRGAHGPALLGGIVRCAGCRHLMSPERADGRVYYRCRRARKTHGECPSRANIPARVIEPYVERAILVHLEGIRANIYKGEYAIETAIAAADQAYAELEAFQRAAQAAGGEPEDFVVGLKQRVDVLQDARATLKRAYSAATPELTAEFMASWADMSIEDRRHVLHGVLGVVWVARGRHTDDLSTRVALIMAGDEPSDIPRPGIGGSGGPIRSVSLDGHLDGQIRVLPA